MRAYTIKDYTNFNRLKKKLRALPVLTKAEKNILRCHTQSKESGITMFKQGEKIGYQGLLTCNNSWCCPCCAPYRLSRTQYYLEAAFEMLKARGYKCLMITFTVPHSSYFKNRQEKEWRPNLHTLGDTLYLLDRTFSTFSKLARFTREARKVHELKSGNYYNQSEEMVKKYKEQKEAAENTTYYSFHIHEATWGSKNGWHPHIHYLIWLKPANFEYFKKQEQKFLKLWIKAEHQVLSEMTWLQNNVKNNWRDLINNQNSSTNQSVYFSKDARGNVREITANSYFWSGAQEVTGLFKKGARQGNLTTWQILKKALDDREPNAEFYFNLYRELINAVPGRCLWTFKKKFLGEIKEYIKTHPREMLQKKKLWQKKHPNEKIQIICWLSHEQWTLLNQEIEHLQIILASLAIQDDAFELIKELCEVFKVGAPLKTPPYGVKMFEKAA